MITSTSNPIVKSARALRDARARRERGLFLIEGLHPVGAALEAGWGIEVLLYAPDILSSDFGNELVEQYSGRKERLSARVLASIAGKENPQGLIAIARRQTANVADSEPRACMVVLERPQDPGNVGTILRTLDAVGGGGLWLLDGGVDPFHPVAIRAAMGATFSIPIVECSVPEFLVWARSNHVFLLGTSARAALGFRDVQPAPPWALVLGSEQKGLSDSLRSACTELVSLPMGGRASSLNLAVAAGVLLYHYCAAT